MKHIYGIGALILICGLAVYLISWARQKEAEAARAHPLNPAMLLGIDWLPENGSTVGEQARFLRGVENRSYRLASMETDYGKRMRAGERMMASRQHWQRELRGVWQNMIDTNSAAYEALLETARHSPGGTTPCTLCDGMSYTPCMLCPDRNAKCIDCDGLGKRGDDYCPTCVGKGTCFLCSGFGKMLCAFCDDGEIDVEHPPPPTLLPVH